MFRSMRRKNQELSKDETIDILKKCSSGVLGVSGDDNYPYCVPMNYVYKDGKIFFHCAKEGHKIDAIKKNKKVSFCVIAKDEIIPECFSSDYRSAIVFGRAKIIGDKEEMRQILWDIVKKYAMNNKEKADFVIENSLDALAVIELSIEHMSGKSAAKHIRNHK